MGTIMRHPSWMPFLFWTTEFRHKMEKFPVLDNNLIADLQINHKFRQLLLQKPLLYRQKVITLQSKRLESTLCYKNINRQKGWK